jgi:hypothetical protein
MSMTDEKKGEYYSLDLDVWEPVTQAKGKNRGEHPVITRNGTVYVDRNRVGEDVRVFIRKQKPKKEE